MSEKTELLIIEDGTKEKIWKHYDKTKQDIDRDIGILKEWLKQQPHLPDDEDDYRLERMLIKNKCRVEKTKKQLENLYTIRTIHPEILAYYNIDGDEFKESLEAVYIYPLPHMTKNLERVICIKITDASKFKIRDVYLTLLFTEYLLKNDYSLSHIFVLDMGAITLDIVKGLNLNVMSLFVHCLLNAFSGKFTQCFYLNAPGYFTIFMAVLKILLKPKLYERIQVNPEDEKIYQYISKDVLPKEYGGNEKSDKLLRDMTIKEIRKDKEYLKKLTEMKSNESLRIGPIKSNELFGTEGSFKKLNLD